MPAPSALAGRLVAPMEHTLLVHPRKDSPVHAPKDESPEGTYVPCDVDVPSQCGLSAMTSPGSNAFQLFESREAIGGFWKVEAKVPRTYVALHPRGVVSPCIRRIEMHPVDWRASSPGDWLRHLSKTWAQSERFVFWAASFADCSRPSWVPTLSTPACFPELRGRRRRVQSGQVLCGRVYG